jgi:hypothetical protein
VRLPSALGRLARLLGDRLLGDPFFVIRQRGCPGESFRNDYKWIVRIALTLKAANEETQFSKAVVAVKDAFPATLLVKGQNPLTLLHGALSSHLHEKSDDECLALAQDVRIVLVELAERLGAALKDEAELNEAVKRLMKARS